ncbi:hypothetical protein DM01DRAFT_1048609 [Hesseltinella vesiculosa]|uniref:Uncharacterized protein n=1 Tax=Hesseltinella vesiculosa TaxID=101127 RepID=A0A1X2GHA8_9FUNG|nr:hypothetical protein DM01DRAFT_1048609 [Hesseltinella vesiculosa]
MAAPNISVHGAKVNPDQLLKESYDEDLEKDVRRIDLRTRELLTNVIQERRTKGEQLLPLAEEMERARSSRVDAIEFTTPHDTTDDLSDNQPITSAFIIHYCLCFS